MNNINHSLKHTERHKSVLRIIQGPCAACMLARVEQERLESLKYDRATIYIKCIDDNEESKLENNSEVWEILLFYY